MKSNIRQEIIAWNNKFPLDRWYRKKYDTPFLSAIHREFTFYGQYLEYWEEKLFKEYFQNKDNEQDFEYKPLSGNWWRGSESTKEEIEDWFNTPI